jgi:hypothetical protein
VTIRTLEPPAETAELVLWAVPVDEPAPVEFRLAEPPPSEPVVTFSLSFRGAEELPPLGFTPRLRRDNEV